MNIITWQVGNEELILQWRGEVGGGGGGKVGGGGEEGGRRWRGKVGGGGILK